MKIIKTVCDMCGKDITDTVQYRFSNWHYRTGKMFTFHMCRDCKLEFEQYIKEKVAENEKRKQNQRIC